MTNHSQLSKPETLYYICYILYPLVFMVLVNTLGFSTCLCRNRQTLLNVWCKLIKKFSTQAIYNIAPNTRFNPNKPYVSFKHIQQNNKNINTIENKCVSTIKFTHDLTDITQKVTRRCLILIHTLQVLVSHTLFWLRPWPSLHGPCHHHHNNSCKKTIR